MKIVIYLTVIVTVTLAWKTIPQWPDDSTIDEELTRKLTRGTKVVLPGDEDYYQLSLQKYLDFTRYPGAIVLVQNKEDVQKCILFARKYFLRVSIRSGGHSFVGRSSADNSLLIDVSQMKKIRVNPNDPDSDTGASAHVEAGNIWIDIYKEMDKYGLLAVGGAANTVSIAGYTLGGGHSALSKMLGLGVDSVLEFTMVTANGDIVTASPTRTVVRSGSQQTINNGDLFWAVSGGGSSFGVVTEFKIKLHQAPEFFVSLQAYMLLESAGDFLDFYGKFMSQDLTKKWGGYLIMSNMPGPVDIDETIFANGSITLRLFHFGGWKEAMDSIKPVTDFLSPPGSKMTWKAMNHTSFYHVFTSFPEEPVYQFYYLISRFIQDEDFEPGFSQLFTKHLKESSPGSACWATHVGGRVSEIDARLSAVNPSFRTAKWSLTCAVLWGNPQEKPGKIKGFQRFRKEFYKYGKGQYYNEPDYHTPNWQDAFWGDNYARLQKVKRDWDPDNFFTCHMCVTIDEQETTDTVSCYKP